MSGPPVTNIYVINDDGSYDPSVLRNLSTILNVDQSQLRRCNIRVTSHNASGYINIHQREQDQLREQEYARRRQEEEDKKKKMEDLKKMFPFLDSRHANGLKSMFNKNFRSEEIIFKSTKAYEAARRGLDVDHFVVVLGYPGQGKTAITKYIIEEFNNRRSASKYKVIYPKSPAELMEKVNPKEFQIVIVDDIFGVHSVNLSKVELWIESLDMIYCIVKAGTSKVRMIITCGLHLYENVEQYLSGRLLFEKSHIVNISAEELNLTTKEREEMLRSHVGHMGHVDSNALTSCNPYTGFPLCCKLYDVSKALQTFGRMFFNDPSKYIPKELEKIEKYDRTVYGVLVFAALNGGEIDLRGKNMSDLEEHVSDRIKNVLHGVNAPADEVELWILQEAAKTLSGIFFINITTDRYCIFHQRITEYVAKQYAFLKCDSMIEVVSTDMFLEFVKSFSYNEGMYEKTFGVQPRSYDTLSSRLVFHILQGNIRTTSMHQVLTDEEFVAFFFNYLVRLGNLDAVHGARDEHGLSFLFWSAWYGRDLIVQAIMEKDSLNRMVDDGVGTVEQREMALLAACYRGGTTEVKPNPRTQNKVVKSTIAISALLKAGVPVNSLGSMDIAPGALACDFSSLLQNRALPLHFAALGNNSPGLQLLLQHGADVNARTENGETALHLAGRENDEEMVKLLIQGGADLNTKSSIGRAPIHDAVTFKKSKSVKLLLEAGADMNHPDEEDRPLLLVAVSNTDADTVKLLVDHGADTSQTGREGWSPLHEAFLLGDTESADYLVEHGADPHVYTVDGECPLRIALSNHDRDLIDVVLEAEGDINKKSSTGETALHIAAKCGKCDVVKTLLDLGANINAKDDQGMLPVNSAAAAYQGGVVRFLMKRMGLRLQNVDLDVDAGNGNMDFDYSDEDDDDDDPGSLRRLRGRQKFPL